MIYSSWGTEQNKMKLVILRHFLPFIPLKPPKIKILKNEKICWRYHHFTHVHQKSQSHDVWFLRQTEFFVILGHFLPFYLSPIMIPNIESSKKKWKKCLEILSFYTYMCTSNDDHMIYGSWDMEHVTDRIFCYFGPFFALLPP